MDIRKYVNRAGYKAKQNSLLRRVLAPYMNWKYRKDDMNYAETGYSQKINQYKNKYKGKRCFIVGNGPSLTLEDLELIKKEYTFGSNRIYSLFESTSWRPTFYVASDMDLIPAMVPFMPTFSPEIRFIDKEAKNIVGHLDSVVLMNVHLDFFSPKKHTTTNISFSSDPSKRISVGYTVTYICLQLAIYMGFSEIYLIGMDHTFTYVIDSDDNVFKNDGIKDHCFSDTKEVIINPQYREGVEFAYALAREEAKKRGIKIYNATRGGSLQVFERASFDMLAFDQALL